MATDPEWQGPLPQAAGVVASSAPMSGIDTVIAWGSVAALVAGGVFFFTGNTRRKATVGIPLLAVGGFGAWYAFGRKVDATENLDGLRAQTRATAAGWGRGAAKAKEEGATAAGWGKGRQKAIARWGSETAWRAQTDFGFVSPFDDSAPDYFNPDYDH